MDDKDELFVEGREGEEDLLDFEFEEIHEEISVVEEDTSFDEEIVELTNIITPGDEGVLIETGELEVVGELDDSVDFKDTFSEESGIEDLEDFNTLKEDESIEEFDADFDEAFDEVKTSERMKGDTAGGISPAGEEIIQFEGNLDDIPDIDEKAVSEIKPEISPEIDQETSQGPGEEDIAGLDVSDMDLDEIDRILEDKLEPEPEDIDLGAMIDELEREEIGLESEELELEAEEDQLEDITGVPLDDLGQLSPSAEIGLESVAQEVLEPEPLESETLEPEPLEYETLEPESLESKILEPETLEKETFERVVIDSKTEDRLAGLSEDKIQQIITNIVKNVVEKAVKESMSDTAEKVIRETIDALKASIESSEE